MMYGADARPAAVLARRFEVLRNVDANVHAALRDKLPALDASGIGDAGLAALVDLLGQICTEEPAGALALVGRLETLVPAPVDVAALRRWAFDGLQRYRSEPSMRRHHFAAGDPLVFADRSAQDDAAHWLASRASLQHYLAGFGLPDVQLELHASHGGPQEPARMRIGADLLLAPRQWPGTDGHARDRLYRAAAAHAAAHLRHSPRLRPAGNRHPMLLAMLSLVEDARVERLMLREHPGLGSLWGGFHVATRAGAGFDLAGLAARLARALHEPGYADGNAWVALGRQLFEHAAADLHDIAAFERIGRLLAVRIEKMRLPFDAARYRVMPVYRDDNSLLWDMNTALPADPDASVPRERFELRPPTPRTPPPTRSAHVDLRRRRHHPEWDCKVQALRENWATVIETPSSHPHAPRARGTATQASRSRLRWRGLERIPDRSVRLRRLREGDELDLGAAVDSVVQRAAGLAPDPRIFRRHGKQRRATAIVLLMDLSESTRRFVPGSFTSVLEVEKHAATLVAESLDESRDRVAVHGFASNGRQEVHYVCIKHFDEPFGAEQKAHLKREDSRLSTRMGAALRHASVALEAESAERKLILLLTDGEPSDVDVFEDDYLVEDARHAVASAAARGIRTFCLTLDRQADPYVRRIFGARNYLIADKAANFAGSAGQALVKLIAQ